MLGPGVLALAPAEAERTKATIHTLAIVKIRGCNNIQPLYPPLFLVPPDPRISTSPPTQSPLNAVKRQAPPDSSLLDLRRPWHMPPPPSLTEVLPTGHHHRPQMLLQALSSLAQRSQSAASGSSSKNTYPKVALRMSMSPGFLEKTTSMKSLCLSESLSRTRTTWPT
jgi:hypothetical protein